MDHINNGLGLCQCHLVTCNLHRTWPWYVVSMCSSFVPSYITVNIILGLPLLFNFYGFSFYLRRMRQWYIRLGYLISINVSLADLSLLLSFFLFSDPFSC